MGMALLNDKQLQMRVSDSFLKLVDDWRRAQPDLPSRSEAIRRLVEAAIAADKAPRK
jgi:metal-responsive CopG/Arc/MetJ family transcriptional regulator